MIKEYYRPKDIHEALKLLSEPENIILTGYSSEYTNSSNKFNVVDLQDIGLDHISRKNNFISIGSITSLHEIINCEYIPTAIKTAIKLDSPLNVRTIKPLINDIFSWTGKSCLATVLLAMDASILFSEGGEKSTLTSFRIMNNNPNSTLISSIEIPLAQTIFKYISATPASLPYICAAISTWANGRTRLTLGGHGVFPILVADGSIEDDLVIAARNAYSEAGDESASSVYRSEMAATLTKRCLKEINFHKS